MRNKLNGIRRRIRWLCQVCLAGAALGFSSGAFAQGASLTADDLGAFFDQHAPREMAKADVAGAAIVVVKDGKLLFARGYGYADVARQTPVLPGTTLFRIASLSKVVTYTAVMQLVEQGKIDLDADVARYLDFPMPVTFAAPVTMRHLMTHTAGFDETFQGRWVGSGPVTSQRAYLVRHMPKRLYAPGTVPAYSSYGTTLAAYILERVAGVPFESYVARHVFDPLGMRHTSFAQPLPPDLAPLLTSSYATAKGGALPFDTAQIGPAASMSTTPLDMAQFMLAHLASPDTTGPSLLKPATLAQMHAAQFRSHRAGPGVNLGMYETDQAGLRWISHTGDIPGFHSAIYLLPEQRLGIFYVQNTEAGAATRTALLALFASRYFPAKPGGTIASPFPAEPVEGSYLTSRRAASSPLSLAFLLGQSVVRLEKPGMLSVDTHRNADGTPVIWQQVGTGDWQSTANPSRHLYFQQQAGGAWAMSDNRDPTQIMHRVSWHQHKLVLLAVAAVSVGALLLTVLAWPLGAFLRRRATPAGLAQPGHRRMQVAALLGLAPWLLYGVIAIVVSNHQLFISSPACAMLLRGVQALAWLGVGATACAIWTTLAGVRTGQSRLRRVHHIVISVACAGATALAWQSNFLFWNGAY